MESLITKRLDTIEGREEIKKYTKYKIVEKQGFTAMIKQQEKDYEYYMCDCCIQEIKITKKEEERTGGIVKLGTHITGLNREIEMALHNKCLKPTLEEFKKILVNKESK